MNLEPIIEQSKSEREKQIYINIHRWDLKKNTGTESLIYKAETETQKENM